MASFESKMAMKGHRIGGLELLQVQGDLKCKIIASPALTDDDKSNARDNGLAQAKTFVGTVTPHVLVCDGGKKSISVEGNIRPARIALGDQALEQVEFIVSKPLSF